MANYMFGKNPKKEDKRTLMFAKFLVAENLPAILTASDVDSQFSNMVDNHMFLNDTLGDCVIAGRGHDTFRLEDFQQGIIVPITDNDIRTEYFKETGGEDSGLDMLASLNAWRQGWQAGGKTYSIYAFAEINISNHNELKYAIMLFYGAYTGFNVPTSAMDQFNAGKIWDVVANDGGIEGGHCVYIVAYNETGPICITWGQRQQMTWAFWDKYFDEAYIVIDNIDSWVNPATDPLNITLLAQELSEVTATPIPVPPTPIPPTPTPPTPPTPIPPTPTPPTPSPCPVGKGAAKILNFVPWVLHRKGRMFYMNPPKEKEKC